MFCRWLLVWRMQWPPGGRNPGLTAQMLQRLPARWPEREKGKKQNYMDVKYYSRGRRQTDTSAFPHLKDSQSGPNHLSNIISHVPSVAEERSDSWSDNDLFFHFKIILNILNMQCFIPITSFNIVQMLLSAKTRKIQIPQSHHYILITCFSFHGEPWLWNWTVIRLLFTVRFPLKFVCVTLRRQIEI